MLDLAGEPAAGRLSIGRDLLVRAADLIRALDRAAAPPVEPVSGKRAKGSRAAAPPPAAQAPPAASVATGSGAPGTVQVEGTAPEPDDETGDGPARDVRAPASERRRAAAVLVDIWRDLSRDLVLVGLGEERRLRDPGILDDLRAAPDLTLAVLGPFLARLDRTAELIEANVSPELALDVLLLAWPRRGRAA